MPTRIIVNLSEDQEAELKQTRDGHPKPYMRERASAVLKVASGKTLTAVAEVGLLKRHEPETIHTWIKSYLSEGLDGWIIKKGRGRKPAFFPKESQSS